MTAAVMRIVTYGSAIAVMTCTATKSTASSETLRCKLTAPNLGRPGSRPCRFTTRPRIMTADSSSSETTPVARLAYHSAVVEVMPFMSGPPVWDGGPGVLTAGRPASRPPW